VSVIGLVAMTTIDHPSIVLPSSADGHSDRVSRQRDANRLGTIRAVSIVTDRSEGRILKFSQKNFWSLRLCRT